MKHIQSYENFVHDHNQEIDKLNEKITQKSFKNAAKKLKKGENTEKLIHTISKGLTDYKDTINAGLKKVLNDQGVNKYYDELNKMLVDTRALSIITLNKEKLKEMVEKYEEIGGDKIDNMIINGEIWKFKFPKYKDELNWEKSMELAREAKKKGHVVINGLEKKDGEVVFKVSSGIGSAAARYSR